MKKIIILSSIIISIVIVCFTFITVYRSYRENKVIENIKSHYSSTVMMNNDSNIYIKNDDKYLPIGNVNEKILLELEDINEITFDTKYFKIKNSNYYVFYEDCTISEESIIEDEIPFEYLIFNQNVITDSNTTLYFNNEEVFNIDEGIDLPLLYQDNSYYYVKYLNKIYGVSKDKSKLKENLNSEYKDSEYISIIHYQNISNECSTDNCINLLTLENQLKILSENNNYSINQEDYIKWIDGNIRLKEKAIIIVVDDDDLINDLFEKYNYHYIKKNEIDNLKITDDNKTTKVKDELDSLSSYLVTEENSNEIITQILNGEEYIKREKLVEQVIENNNIDDNSIGNDIFEKNENATNIAVINYHFFYDENQGQSCNESICLEASKFEEQLKYLNDNGYKTLTIDEFASWMYGEIELPKKSVLLTIDDGAKGTGINNGNVLIPLLEKYQIHATLFLISGWWSPDNYRSEYLDIQSHTSDMHREGYCNGETRGSQLLCSSYEEIIDDLNNSINDVDSNIAFCFPFYAYNDKVLKALEEKNFKIAFIGGGVKASRNSNKYLIPRYPIYKSVTLEQFINYIN